jgi:hypothetical protein
MRPPLLFTISMNFTVPPYSFLLAIYTRHFSSTVCMSVGIGVSNPPFQVKNPSSTQVGWKCSVEKIVSLSILN